MHTKPGLSFIALALLLISCFLAGTVYSQSALTDGCPPSTQSLGCVDYTLSMCSNSISAGNQPETSCNIEPTDIFVNPVSQQIYISDASNRGNGQCPCTAVMDPSTGTVVGGVAGSYLPSQSVYDPSNGMIYVASYYGHSSSVSTSGTVYSEYVSVLDAATGTAVANITIGTSLDNQNQGWGIALDPNNGYIYADVYTGASGNVSVIDTASNTVVATIQGFNNCSAPTPCLPRSVFYDPVSGYVYVGEQYGSNITLLNPATNTVVGSITNFIQGNPDISPSYFAYDSKDGLVYVTDSNANLVTVIGAQNNSIIETIGAEAINQQTGAVSFAGGEYNGTSPLGIAYASSLDYVYVANQQSDNVTVINCATNQILGSIAVGEFPEGITYDQFNGFLYVTNSQSDSISTLGPATVTTTTTNTGLTSFPTTMTSQTQSLSSSTINSTTPTTTPTTPLTTSMSTTVGTSTSGIPEFPGQLLVAAVFTIIVVLSYVGARRRLEIRG